MREIAKKIALFLFVAVSDNIPVVRDFDSNLYAREFNKGFMIGWFEAEAKAAFQDGTIPKNWSKSLTYDWKHLSKFILYYFKVYKLILL